MTLANNLLECNRRKRKNCIGHCDNENQLKTWKEDGKLWEQNGTCR